jgi:hypothetical protein
MCPSPRDGHAGSTQDLPKYVDPKKTETGERGPKRERRESEKGGQNQEGNKEGKGRACNAHLGFYVVGSICARSLTVDPVTWTWWCCGLEATHYSLNWGCCGTFIA